MKPSVLAALCLDPLHHPVQSRCDEVLDCGILWEVLEPLVAGVDELLLGLTPNTRQQGKCGLSDLHFNLQTRSMLSGKAAVPTLTAALYEKVLMLFGMPQGTTGPAVASVPIFKPDMILSLQTNLPLTLSQQKYVLYVHI